MTINMGRLIGRAVGEGQPLPQVDRHHATAQSASLAMGGFSMRVMTWVGLAMAVVLASACSVVKTFDQVVAGDVAGLRARGTAELQGPEAEAAVKQLQALIPKAPPTSSRTLRWQVFTSFSGGGEQASIVREYTWPTHVALADTTLARPGAGQPWQVRGFNLRIATNAELEANRFTLTGRSPLHYLVLAGAVLSPLICLFGFITVLTAPKFKWKWAFAIFSLLAFVQFTLNWSTGAFNVQPISFQLLGAGFFSGGSAFDAWMLSFSLPIGAAVAIWRARKAREDARKAKVTLFDAPRTEPAGS
jgi:hypothetical protein